ncbi:hypothetical protein F2Q69_00048253 [Brassica cretica]|uniref:Uncharacterized protein n=4 Tax=Brassica TaxID=3705 RepID=A0A8S9PXM3_BRACR|nr:hypothetical protein DY000_02060752 [Brassica cretica]KAF3524391.1 hypothetical protein F2Q69_00048253 [Brassica cretica]
MAEQDRNNRSNTIPIIGSEFVRPQPSDLTIIRDTVKHANRNKVFKVKTPLSVSTTRGFCLILMTLLSSP